MTHNGQGMAKAGHLFVCQAILAQNLILVTILSRCHNSCKSTSDMKPGNPNF